MIMKKPQLQEPAKRYSSVETFIEAKLKDASESLKNVDLSILQNRRPIVKD